MNVRTAILYRKGLATLVDESVSDARRIQSSADSTPGRRVVATDAAVVSDCIRAAVTGAATDVLLGVWIQGCVPVQKVWDVVL